MEKQIESCSSLEKFNCAGETTNVAQRWKRWLRSFEWYIEAKGIVDAKRKKALLLHHAGPEVQDIFCTLQVEETDDVYKDTKDALDKYLVPHKNITYERHIFRQMQQRDDETVDQFLTRLRQQANNCEFSKIDEEMLSQLIDKCKSNNLRRHIIEKGSDINLKGAADIARSMEIAEKQASEIESTFKKLEVNKVVKKKNANVQCYRCGEKGHFSRDKECTGWKQKCEKCGLKGPRKCVKPN